MVIVVVVVLLLVILVVLPLGGHTIGGAADTQHGNIYVHHMCVIMLSILYIYMYVSLWRITYVSKKCEISSHIYIYIYF